MSTSGMAGSYGSHILDFLRNCQNVFQSGCTVFHFHGQWMTVPVAAYLHQHWVWSVIVLDILIGMLCYLIVVLISLSPGTNDTAHIFMWLPIVYLFWYSVCSDHLLIFLGVVSFSVKFESTLVWIQVLYQIM